MKPSGSDRLPLPAARDAGWAPLADVARRLQVNRITVWRWVARGILPSKRVGQRRILIPVEAAEALVKSWKCPACPYEAAALSILAAHLRAQHARDSRKDWTCPRCARSLSASETLAKHVEGHASRVKAEGRGERKQVGGRFRVGPARTCRGKDCERPAYAKGLCMKHYQRARRGRYRNGK